MAKSKKRILILVEGARTDVAVMEKLLNTFGLDVRYDIVSYRTNIYVLYREMFLGNAVSPEEMDLLQVLKAREKDLSVKPLFDEKFTDILLIFDLDPQDPQFDPDHIRQMQAYFRESSDMGKLYLNYPMIEAFYHMRAIPDSGFNGLTVSLDELKAGSYKARVHKETCGKDYRRFAVSRDDLRVVILQNQAKALSLIDDALLWNQVLPSMQVDLYTVLDAQLKAWRCGHFVYVLCTCILYIADDYPRLLQTNDTGSTTSNAELNSSQI